jgi:vesicle-associated membrane protein 72
MPGLVYTFVARGTTVLAEYAAISGNFKTVGIECLQNAQMQEDKFVVTADQYTFNYLVQQGYSKCQLR